MTSARLESVIRPGAGRNRSGRPWPQSGIRRGGSAIREEGDVGHASRFDGAHRNRNAADGMESASNVDWRRIEHAESSKERRTESAASPTPRPNRFHDLPDTNSACLNRTGNSRAGKHAPSRDGPAPSQVVSPGRKASMAPGSSGRQAVGNATGPSRTRRTAAKAVIVRSGEKGVSWAVAAATRT